MTGRFSLILASGRARVALAALGLLGALAVAACTPSIGDQCNLSTDCSLRGDRLCDNSQPGGYCTQFNCKGDSCPDKAACVLFHASVPGCGFNDRVPSRSGRTFCMAQCSSNGDCRNGYVCADPRQAPWSALIIDDVQSQRVCIVPPDDGIIGADASVTPSNAPVCSPDTPDASFPDGAISVIDAGDAGDAADGGATDAARDAAGEGGSDAGVDAASEAGDGGPTDAGAG